MARARTAVTEDLPAEPDQLPNIALPRAQDRFLGHVSAEQTFLNAYRSGRLHHAWLITGPRGIGKATFAFRAARFLLTHGHPDLPAVTRAGDLAVAPDSLDAQRIAAGSHGAVLHLIRDWDHDRKRFKRDLTVETIRKTGRFFGSTAASEGWRIAIVDAADDMNQNSANALLKILEEPPAKSIFFVLAHVPGRLLPTIRSRCRTLSLSPLGHETMNEVLGALGFDGTPADRRATAIDLAEGSVRSAVRLLTGSGPELVEKIDALLTSEAPAPIAVHALADVIGHGQNDEALDMFQVRLRQHLTARARDLAVTGQNGLARAARHAEILKVLERDIVRTEAFNLDRRQLVLSIFRTLAEVGRTA